MRVSPPHPSGFKHPLANFFTQRNNNPTIKPFSILSIQPAFQGYSEGSHMHPRPNTKTRFKISGETQRGQYTQHRLWVKLVCKTSLDVMVFCIFLPIGVKNTLLTRFGAPFSPPTRRPTNRNYALFRLCKGPSIKTHSPNRAANGLRRGSANFSNGNRPMEERTAKNRNPHPTFCGAPLYI